MPSLLDNWPAPLRCMYYANQSSWASLQANADSFDCLIPQYYNLREDGSLSGGNQATVTNFARSKNLKIIPMIQNVVTGDNFNHLLSDGVKLNHFIELINSEFTANQYDGIHIDFETLNPGSETILTEFMRRLFLRLHPAGKLVTIAVMARTGASTNPAKLAYNFQSLAPFVDLVTVMTYDFSWKGGEPGPVAPLTLQESTMNYAVSTFGAEKLLLGVPFYGYDWNLTRRQTDPKCLAETRFYNDVINLQRDNHGSFGYDTPTESPFLDYQKAGENHRVWFDNARSLLAKFQLMQRLKVRGFAAWRLGQDGTDLWPSISNLAAHSPVTFSETGHTLQGEFLKFWQLNGGLGQFGFPLTDELAEPSAAGPGTQLKVQYFERAKFELHPDLAGPGSKVLLALLGRLVTRGREQEPPFLAVPDPGSPTQINYFPETGHTLGGDFRQYWETHGSLSILGFPISEEFSEKNRSDNQVYTVQYFERARFERHPGTNGSPSTVMLGLLGREILNQ